MASPAGKKKEENSLKLLRELISLPHNKQCFECQQKGPTYVDMTTVAFICTQCSGFLRGVNPPHRVKSVSMTTFSSEEIEKLRNGGNEMARMIWMGRWDPKRDREPTKKDEQAFKEFLRDKYDRKKWYRDPSEVKKDIASKSPDATPTSPPTSLPTPPTQSNSRPVATATSSTPPSKPTTQQPASKPQNLIDDFGDDPFAPKVPTGGVSVLPSIPPGPTPLISTSPIPVVSQQQGGTSNDFGAFTSATTSGGGLLQPSNTSGGISQPSGAQPPASNPLTIPLGSGSDRYAALASLDQTLKDIRLKEEEKEQQEKQQQLLQQQQQQQQLLQQQQQQQQQQLMQQQQQMMQQQLLQQQQRAGMMGGRPNPFGATPPIQKQDSNPFLLGTAPPVTGPTKMQGGAFGPSMVGGYAPGMMGGMPMQQPQQFGGFPGQQGMMMAGPVGSMMPGGQGMMMPQGGAQWQQPQQQAQWGMMQMPGGMGVAPGTPPQQFSTPQQFSGFGGNQTNKAGTQFGGFVSASPDNTPTLATGRQLNWSTGQTTPTTTAATSFNTNMGWSSDLSKPTISSQPQVSTVPTGWSTGLMTGAGTQFGTQTQQPTGGWGNQTTSMGGWGAVTQPQSNTSGWGAQSSMGGWGVGVQPNPFSKPSGSSQQQPSNPFM